MRTLKLFLKRMKVEKSYLIVIAILSIFIVVGYFSYAMFTVSSEQKEAIRIITGTLTGELKVDNVETDKLVVNQGETKEFTITLKNNNDRTARYLLYYIGTFPNNLEIGYIVGNALQIPPEDKGRKIDKDITETYKIRVRNKTESSQTIQLKLDVGLEKFDLNIPSNGNLFKKYVTGTELFLENHVNEENAEFGDNTKDKMFVFHHEIGAQQENWTEEETTDYRYIGTDPNNYVTFNDEEVGWRIIGVFTVENENGEREKRIKLIKKDFFGTYEWDKANNGDWPNATLMKQLNSGYDETIFNLTDEAEKMTSNNVKWYLGRISDDKFKTDANVNDLYREERGLGKYNSRLISWKGKVGLIYVSDFGYATSGGENISRNDCFLKEMINWEEETLKECKENNWLDGISWTITNTDNPYGVINVHSAWGLRTIMPGHSGYRSYPVIYLVPDIQYLNGSGTKEEPFEFTL